jgi:NAD(P)-dependent dehydrogenase (short-subunit alcohol dehydrogenase family)
MQRGQWRIAESTYERLYEEVEKFEKMPNLTAHYLKRVPPPSPRRVEAMSRLRGKVAIVTGAGQGVGQGIAYALAAEGAAVVVAGRTESKLQDTCRGILERGGQALPVVCDVFEADDIERTVATTVDTLGGIDILVNNAYDGAFGRCSRSTTRRSCAASSRGRSRRSASCARVIRT